MFIWIVALSVAEALNLRKGKQIINIINVLKCGTGE